MTILAAMAFSKVIVYADNPTINHYVTDNVSGLMYEAGNHEMLKSHIIRLMTDKSLGKNLSTSALLQYQKNYKKNIELEEIAQFILDTYQEETYKLTFNS